MRRPRLFALAPRLIVGIYLLLCAALIFDSALTLHVVPLGAYLMPPALGLGIVLILVGLLVTGLAGQESIRIWTVLLSLAFISTLLSALHTAGNGPPPPNVCGVIFRNYGFPLPWYGTTRFHLPAAGPLCFLPLVVPSRVDSLAFTMDTIFYAGLYLAALEVYRGVRLFYVKLFSGT